MSAAWTLTRSRGTAEWQIRSHILRMNLLDFRDLIAIRRSPSLQHRSAGYNLQDDSPSGNIRISKTTCPAGQVDVFNAPDGPPPVARSWRR